MAHVKGFRPLLDEVREAVDARRRWWEALPEPAQQELLEIRRRFAAGEIHGKPFQIASAIVRAAKARGWKTPQEKGIVEWLRKSDD
jgi:hypothetical protein